MVLATLRLLRRWFRQLAFATVCLLTLAALFLTEENYRGRRAWESYQREAAARGTPVEFIHDLAPPPVPDDQNFWATPLLNPLRSDGSIGSVKQTEAYGTTLTNRLAGGLQAQRYPFYPSPGDWEFSKHINWDEIAKYTGPTGIEHLLQQDETEMAEISAAARRPFGRVGTRYDLDFRPSPNFKVLRIVSWLFSLRAQAALNAGQPALALDDILTMVRMARLLSDEPIAVSQMISVLGLKGAIQPAWEGLSARHWNEAQLTTLQDTFQQVDVLAQLAFCLRCGRAEWDGLPSYFEAHAADVPWSEVPAGKWGLGWFDQNVVTGDRLYLDYVLPVLDLKNRRVYPEKLADLGKEIDRVVQQWWPHCFLIKEGFPYYNKMVEEMAHTQDGVEMVVLACALERYALAHGDYPEKLDALVPQFLAQLPHDVVTGGPLGYARTPDGRYKLTAQWHTPDANTKNDSAAGLSTDQPAWVWKY